jgi:hypothetical protein
VSPSTIRAQFKREIVRLWTQNPILEESGTSMPRRLEVVILRVGGTSKY